MLKIEQSTVAMASSREFQMNAKVTRTTVDRWHGDNGHITKASATTGWMSRLEKGASAAVFVQGRAQGSGAAAGKEGVPVNAWGTDAAALPQGTEGLPLEADGIPVNTQQTSSPSQPAGIGGQMAPDGKSHDWLSEVMDSIEKDPKIQMMRKLLEMLERYTGKRFSVRDPFLTKGMGDSNPRNLGSTTGYGRYNRAASGYGFGLLNAGSINPLAVLRDSAAQMVIPAGGVNLTVQPVNGYWTRQVYESGAVKGEEHTTFSSKGTVVTSDGRTIDFGINLSMSRDFEEAYEVYGKEQVFTDPLIINMDTDAAELADVTFHFDLNGDGEKEEISQLKSNSGFLAYDRNGDGIINDGTELFGAKTGNGFAELAQYDEDGNGWIDENDSIFSKLSVWVQCGNGEGKLLSLSEADVGAIFLGSQSTDFSLANSYGDVNAVVRRTGVYMRESGTVGTVQHVDLRAQ